MNMGETFLFEVVDATDEEQYLPLGIFLTKADAVEAIRTDEPPCDGEELIRVEVRRRKVGWGDASKVVHVREWVQDYDEGGNEWKWKVKPDAPP